MTADPAEAIPPDCRIVVLVGTDHHPFDRAVQWADSLVAERRAAGERVELRVQGGSSQPSRHGENAEILTPARMREWLDWADVAIVHAGPGTIAAARRAGHLPVVLARDPSLGEHVDDHQQRFARWVADRSLGLVVDQSHELADAVLQAMRERGSKDAVDEHIQHNALRAGSMLDGTGRPTRPRVVYLGGIGRSGSTLLETLLAATPGVVAVGETVHLWQRGLLDNDRCSCGEQFLECPFWSAVGTAAFDGWNAQLARQALTLQAEVDRTRYVPMTLHSRGQLLRQARLRRYGRFYSSLYAAALACSGAEVVVDSSKHVSLAAALAVSDEVDLRVVQVVRDPKSVADSWAKTVERPESATGDMMATASEIRIAGRWTLQNALFGLVARRAQLMLVRFDDLVADPNRVVADVRRFADLPDAPGPVGGDGIVERPELHSAAGNPLRFDAGPLQVRQPASPVGSVAASDATNAGGLALRLLTRPLASRYFRGRNS